MGCRPWSHKESDTTEVTQQQQEPGGKAAGEGTSLGTWKSNRREKKATDQRKHGLLGL